MTAVAVHLVLWLLGMLLRGEGTKECWELKGGCDGERSIEVGNALRVKMGNSWHAGFTSVRRARRTLEYLPESQEGTKSNYSGRNPI